MFLMVFLSVLFYSGFIGFLFAYLFYKERENESVCGGWTAGRWGGYGVGDTAIRTYYI